MLKDRLQGEPIMKLTLIVTLMTLLSSTAFAGPISSGGDEKAREFNCYSPAHIDELFEIRVRDVAGTIAEVSLWTMGSEGHLEKRSAVNVNVNLNPQVDAYQLDHTDINEQLVMSVLPIEGLGIFAGQFPETNFRKDALQMSCVEIK